jgi:hypothetical protein
MRRRPPAFGLWLLAPIAAALAMGGLTPATADQGTSPQTFDGPAYSAAYPQPPTGAENQSKLWFHADAWWALLVEPTGRSLRVFELMPDHSWRPTSAVVNADVGDVGDALRDGDTVHVLTRSSDASLFYVRLSFDAAARDYRAAPAALVTTRRSSTPATIAKDTAGALWVGYANATNVVVTHSEDGGLTWGRVVTLAATVTAATPEVGELVAYDDRVGMLWSDQSTGSFRFASHRAGDDPALWAHEVAVAGPAQADNHVSLARIPGEAGDTLVAVVKTAHGDAMGDPAAGLVELLVRAPGGQWSTVPVSAIADRLDDPVLQVDLATRKLHVFATHNLSIVRKTSPLDTIGFTPGIGQIFVNGTGHRLSDPTVTKEPVDARSGLVVLASDTNSLTYRHAELSLSPSTPVADPQDRTPPTAPPGLQARALSPESAVLTWEAANDGERWVPGGTGVPVAGYVVSRNGVEVATVTSTIFEDRARAAPEATDATSIEYSVVAVDASGNRSVPTTLVVELPGSEQPRPLVIGAIGLLVLAGVVTAGHFLYRLAVARGARLPRSPQPTRGEARTRTPVA